jgi:hypothetical protein
MWGATKKFIEFTQRTATFPNKLATRNGLFTHYSIFFIFNFDKVAKSRKSLMTVIPAKAGIQ